MKDEDLRALLLAWARPVESAPAPDLEIIRRRAQRRVRRIAAASLCGALVGCVALATLVPTLLRGSAEPRVNGARATGWLPPGPLIPADAGPASAPFAIILDPRVAGSPAVVYRVSRSMPRPRQLAVIRPPGRGLTFANVLAAGDNRTFLLAALSNAHGGNAPVRFYEESLDRQGSPGALIPLRLRLPGALPSPAALTPDGSELAVVARSGPHARRLEVVTLATGAITSWLAGARPYQLVALSWQAGDKLVVLTSPPHGDSPRLSLLDTSRTRDRTFRSLRQIVPDSIRLGRFSGLAIGSVTATGSATAPGPTIYALMSAPDQPVRSQGPGMALAVVAISERSGRPERIVSQAAVSGMGFQCGVLWADRSGRQVVTSCGNDLGSTRDGRFTLWSNRSFWYSLKDVPFAW